MESNNNKNLGQYFTPKDVADFMVSLISKETNSKILEPSAGKGVFLRALTEKGFGNIIAYEIDSTLENGSEVDIEYKDFLVTNPDEKFDVVIGNPPYVRWKNIPIDMRDKLKSNPYWSDRINGLNDLLYLFIIHSIDKLKEGGELIFVTPNFWTSTLHSKGVRKTIINQGILQIMINFNEMRIFNNVSSNILIFKFKKTKSREPIKIIEANHKKAISKQIIEQVGNLLNQLNSEEEISDNSIIAYNYPQFDSQESWKPFPPSVESKILPIENNATLHLGDIVDIGNGMVSGLDAAFKVENIDRFTEDERRKFINVVKAKNFIKYFNEGYTPYIFLNDILEENKLLDFPNIHQKLSEYKEDLEKRYSYGIEIPWWHWVFLRNKKLIEKSPKIVVPCKERFDSKGYVRFALVEGNFYVTQDVTVILKKSGTKEDIKYLLALLNSDLIFDWLKYRGLKRGGVLEFSEKPLSEIPIRLIDWSDEREVSVHDEIVSLINKILDTKQAETFKDKIEVLVRSLYTKKKNMVVDIEKNSIRKETSQLNLAQF